VYGKCIQQSNKQFNCQCLPGYTGSACDVDIKECNQNPCLNNGVCTEPFINMYMCTCKSGFTGFNCENVLRICDSSPCMNYGVCNQMSVDNFQCHCVPGFNGTKYLFILVFRDLSVYFRLNNLLLSILKMRNSNR
jgi:hypothetical protein